MSTNQFNKNHVIMIVLVALGIIGVWYGYKTYKQSKEGYINYPLTASVQRVAVTPNGRTSLVPASASGTQFVSVPNYQSMLSPRFMSDSYGTNIRYSPPKYENTGVPLNPLGYKTLATENFSGNDQGCSQCNGNCGSVCGQSGMASVDMNQIGIKNGSIIDHTNTTPSFSSEIIDAVPIGTMDEATLDGPVQSIVYDRLIYSTSKDKYYKQGGDPIRGDLAIAPRPSTPETRWFQTTGNPVSSLVTGYMQSLAGSSVDNNRDMADLLVKYKGNASLIGGGETTLSNLGVGGDVQVTAFP